MTDDDHLRPLNQQERTAIEGIVGAFEDAWAAGGEPSFASFLPPAGPLYLPALVELALVDLELRLKLQQPIASEQYVQRFPELAEARYASLLARSEDRLRKSASNQRLLPRGPAQSEATQADSGVRFPYRLNCPHCHEPIAVAAESSSSDVVCPCCGSTFRLDGDASETWQPDRLPKLGKFELLKLVGRGSFGAVYRARDMELRRTVAVKLPRSGSFSTKEDENRFIREARSAAQLQHPGIVQVYEVGRNELYPYIVSEFVDGITLSEFLTGGELGQRESAQLIAEVADALDHAHQHGIVHRDLKPSNIMLEPRTPPPGDERAPAAAEGRPEQRATLQLPRFRPRLMDFGLARREGEDITLAIEGQPLGTPAYMSPEQARGDGGEVDGRSDVYSLGVILYRVIVGELPFRGNARMLLHQVQHEEPIPPRRMNDRIHRDLQTICLKAMAKNPRHRYATAALLAADLRHFLAGEPILARPVGRVERAWRWCYRNPTATGLIASLLVALCAVTAAVWFSWENYRGQQLQALLARFDHKLDRPAESAEYIDDVHLLVDDISRMNEQRGQERLARFDAHYDQFLQTRIRADGLSLQNIAALHALLDAWKPRHLQSEAKLRGELQLRDQQRELFELNPGLPAAAAALAQVFAGAAAIEGGQFVAASPATGKWNLLRTTVASPTSLEFEVTYAPGWEQAAAVGLALGCTGDEQRNPQYLLLLRAADERAGAAALPQPQTFAAARAAGQMVFLEIWRGERRIKRFPLPAASIGGGPLRLWAQRLSNRFHLQVNTLPQLSFVEIFLAPSDSAGTLGVVWPGGVGVQRLAAYQFRSAEQATFLQRGDELLATGAYDQALELYQKHAQQAAGTSRDEARLRQGICLAELGRRAEAETLLSELADANDEQVARAAKLRLWHLLVLAGELKSKKADDVFQSLGSSQDISDIAVLLPDDVREQLIAAYLKSAPITGYSAVRPYPNRVRDFERLLQVLELLEAPPEQILIARVSLMMAYRHDRRLAEALLMCERLLARDDVRAVPPKHAFLLEQYVHVLLELGRADEALAAIDAVLAQRVKNPVYAALRVDRACVLSAQQRTEAALDEINKLLSDDSPEVKQHGCQIDARLVGGFLLEDLGRPEEAQRMWRDGLAAVRRDQSDNPSLYYSLFGSLTNDITAEDALRITDMVVVQASDSPVLKFLAQRFAPTDLVATTLRNMWRSPRGKQYARQLVLKQLSLAESGQIQVVLVAHEIFRQAVQNSPELEPPLPADLDRVLWKVSEDSFAQFLAETVREATVVQLMLAWQGTTGVLGWKTAARSMPPHCRGPLAFIFACRYIQLDRPEDARRFLDEALTLAEPGSDLRRLVEQRQADLAARSAAKGG